MKFPTLCALLVAAIAIGSSYASAQSSDQAFDAFLDQVDAMRQDIIDRTPEGDGPRRVGGYQQLMRMMVQGIGVFGDDFDTLHPRLGRCPSTNCKLGQDNPDNSYVGFRIDGNHTYRVFGQLNDGFGVLQIRSRRGLSLQHSSTEELAIKPDGSYEIFLSPDPQPGNWMQTEPDSYFFIARFYYDDWNNDWEPGLQVEVMGNDDGDTPVPLMTPEIFEEKVAEMSDWMSQFALMNTRPDVFPVNAITPRHCQDNGDVRSVHRRVSAVCVFCNFDELPTL